MHSKFYSPNYKVHRSPEKGLYYVQVTGKLPEYIRKTQIGSRSFYRVHNAPLFPTLRDAILHIVHGV